MLPWIYGVSLSILFRIIPALLGIYYWKCFDKEERFFIALLNYDVLNIIIGAFLAYNFNNNMIMGNLYSIIEVILLSLFFKKYIHSRGARVILTLFPIIYSVWYIAVLIITDGIHSNIPSSYAVRSLFIIVLGSNAMGQIVGDDSNLVKQGHFWIILGLTSYYLINFGYLSMKYWLLQTGSSILMDLFLVLFYSFFVVNILIALGLWLIAKERKRQIQST